jgi:trk system potassium uptake protein TrkA
VGQRVGDVLWPPDTALVALLRSGQVIAPSPDDPLETGDELLFVCTPDQEPAIQDLLSPQGPLA